MGDQTVFFFKCGYPLNRGATKVEFHCIVDGEDDDDDDIDGIKYMKFATKSILQKNLKKNVFFKIN